VQRWHDHEHDTSTQEGIDQAGVGQRLAEIFGGPHGGNFPRYNDPDAVKERLGDASVNMDRFAAGPTEIADPTKETHNVGRLPTLAKFGASMTTSFLGHAAKQAERGLGRFLTGQEPPKWKAGDFLPPRGIYGEGPDHAETGDYTLAEGASSQGNLERENHYIGESLKQFDTGNVDEALNRLGDAAHVSADRGSHGEGAKGAGHDTPRPPPGHEGTTQMPYFMEGWEDNDDKGMNPAGYTYGVARTKELFQRFVAAAGPRGTPAGTPAGPQPRRRGRTPMPLPPPGPAQGIGHQGGDQDHG
jgi:hypothetical protein